MLTKCDDAWVQTIGLLNLLSANRGAGVDKKDKNAARVQRGMRDFMHDREARGVCVSVIDKPSASTATIAWRDPTVGCYGDQVWRASVSRSHGVCAMSGLPILPGDAIYRPRARHPLPLNLTEMILAAVVHDAVEGG
jgi:Domain of unknown function (DUF3331)